MAAIVVPFRGANGKQRLNALPKRTRTALSLAMLADVVAACAAAGRTLVVTSDDAGAAAARELGAEVVEDPGGGQGAAVAAALRLLDGRVLVVNADLPCVAPADVRALEAATPEQGLAYVAAEDGTTNALGLSSPSLFASLYGPASAERFRRHAHALGVDVVAAPIPNLIVDVDSPADLARAEPRAGARTSAVRPG